MLGSVAARAGGRALLSSSPPGRRRGVRALCTVSSVCMSYKSVEYEVHGIGRGAPAVAAAARAWAPCSHPLLLQLLLACGLPMLAIV